MKRPITSTYVIPLYNAIDPIQTAHQMHIDSYDDDLFMVYIHNTLTNVTLTHGVYCRGGSDGTSKGTIGTYTYRDSVPFPYEHVVISYVRDLRAERFTVESLNQLSTINLYTKEIMNGDTKIEIKIHKRETNQYYSITTSVDNHSSYAAVDDQILEKGDRKSPLHKELVKLTARHHSHQSLIDMGYQHSIF